MSEIKISIIFHKLKILILQKYINNNFLSNLNLINFVQCFV